MEKYSVKKPFTVLVAVLIVFLMGFVSLTNLRTDLLPEISTPYLMVVTVYPGASPEKVETEVSLIDTDGSIFRPDRVICDGDSVTIVDYKFGEHRSIYRRQLDRYADIYRRMGYADVSAYLWYVFTDEVVTVC